MSPKIDGTPVPTYEAVLVKAGSELTLGFTNGNGCRSYIAFAGGLDIPIVMGSKATLMRNNLGGYEGRKLEKGDRIGFIEPKTSLPNMEERHMNQPTFLKKEVTLRVVTGPQDTDFSEEELKHFFWYGAEITNEFDRMGCRLKRETPLKHLGDGNIITDGIAFGSIQIPGNGQPIIMLADRQSTGGYPKIGTVISVDIPKLTQSVAGFRVRFVQVSIQLAQKLYIEKMKKYEALERRFRQDS